MEDFREREILIKYANVIKLGEAFVAAKKDFEDSVDYKAIKKIEGDRVKELDRRFDLVSKDKLDVKRIEAEEARRERRKSARNQESRPASSSMVKIEATIPSSSIKTTGVIKSKEVKPKESKDGKKG